MNEKINLIINKTGYIFCLLVGMSLFFSEKFENNVVIPLLMILFLISMLIKNNRKEILENINLDLEFSIELLLFVCVPFIIAYLDGGIKTRLDNYILRYLIFFPFMYFLGNKKIGFNFLRVTAILTVQDFANIMCIIFLFLLSFLLFYKNEDNKKNKIIKIFLFSIMMLTLFLVIVNRSKMVYICLIPTILYIVYKKKKRFIPIVFLICLGGYFVLPSSISNRLQYIVNYKKDPSSNLRVIFWKTGLEAFKQKPLYGWKAEERKQFNLDYYKKTGVSDYVHKNFLDRLSEWKIYYVHTHNTYLQFLLDFGIIGTLFLVIFFVSIAFKAMKINFSKNMENSDSKLVALEIATKSSLAAWAIQGITDINLNNKYMVIVSMILIFLLNYLWKEKINLERGKTINE